MKGNSVANKDYDISATSMNATRGATFYAWLQKWTQFYSNGLIEKKFNCCSRLIFFVNEKNLGLIAKCNLLFHSFHTRQRLGLISEECDARGVEGGEKNAGKGEKVEGGGEGGGGDGGGGVGGGGGGGSNSRNVGSGNGHDNNHRRKYTDEKDEKNATLSKKKQSTSISESNSFGKEDGGGGGGGIGLVGRLRRNNSSSVALNENGKDVELASRGSDVGSNEGGEAQGGANDSFVISAPTAVDEVTALCAVRPPIDYVNDIEAFVERASVSSVLILADLSNANDETLPIDICAAERGFDVLDAARASLHFDDDSDLIVANDEDEVEAAAAAAKEQLSSEAEKSAAAAMIKKKKKKNKKEEEQWVKSLPRSQRTGMRAFPIVFECHSALVDEQQLDEQASATSESSVHASTESGSAAAAPPASHQSFLYNKLALQKAQKQAVAAATALNATFASPSKSSNQELAKITTQQHLPNIISLIFDNKTLLSSEELLHHNDTNNATYFLTSIDVNLYLCVICPNKRRAQDRLINDFIPGLASALRLLPVFNSLKNK